MGEVVQGPWPKDPEHRRIKEAEDKRQYDEGPTPTLVISDSVFALPANAFKWPSAGPVDSRYEKALEEQKKRRNDS